MFESNVPTGEPSNADDTAHTSPQQQLKCLCGHCAACTTAKMPPDLGLAQVTDFSLTAMNATSDSSNTADDAGHPPRRMSAASRALASERRRWERELKRPQLNVAQGRLLPLRDLVSRIATVLGNHARAKDMARSVALFEQAVGTKPFADIRLDDAYTFVYFLRFAGTREPTLVRHVANLSSLVRQCSKHRVLPSETDNPFSELAASLRRAAPVACRSYPLQEVELQRLLTAPEFVAARDGTQDLHTARFWLTMTVLLTGARSIELMGVTVLDLMRQGETWMLRLPETRHQYGTNTFQLGRWVPLHEELIRCGFLAYAARRKLDGQVHLFASRFEGHSRTTALASANRWLSRLTRSLGLAPGRQNLASLRYNFIGACIGSGMPTEFVHQLTGLGGRLRASRRVWIGEMQSGALPRWAAEFMARVRFEGAAISHLYVDEPHKDTEAAFGSCESDNP